MKPSIIQQHRNAVERVCAAARTFYSARTKQPVNHIQSAESASWNVLKTAVEDLEAFYLKHPDWDSPEVIQEAEPGASGDSEAPEPVQEPTDCGGAEMAVFDIPEEFKGVCFIHKPKMPPQKEGG